MKYQILGTVTPMLEVALNKGEGIYAQTGAMQWMDNDVEMKTEMKGGVMGAIKRGIGGEKMFVVNFSTKKDGATVAFGHSYPGNIIAVDVSKRALITQQRSFLCAEDTVKFDIHLQKKLGAGFFGGEGFIMQKLSGKGMAFIEIDGECIKKKLSPGEVIKVNTGAVGAYEESVKMSIGLVKGFKNMLFGGEGMFLTTLTGPGTVWIQTMPIQCMVGEMQKYMNIEGSD